MTIKHILKDGTVLDDIQGHVVKMSDAKSIYNLMDCINDSRTYQRKRGRNVTKKVK